MAFRCESLLRPPVFGSLLLSLTSGGRRDGRSLHGVRLDSAAVLILLGVVVASPTAGQVIQGTVREEDAGRIIAGGFISLLNRTGTAVSSDFTDSDGRFFVSAPSPGEYRVRVERIGYANWVTEPYLLSTEQARTVAIEVPRRPIRLEDLHVEVGRSCLDDSSQAVELAIVWEEARKALETAVWAEGQGELTFTLLEYDRTLAPRGLAELESETRTRRRVRLPPFESLPARRLVEDGFAVLDADSSIFYAPDARVLLSAEFRSSQCFGLRRDEVDDEPMLGVTFRPRDDNDLVQIEGTIWLDEESAELRRVQIRYRNVPLPRGARRELVGANLIFDRVPDGPFFVREWWLRFPIARAIRRGGAIGLSLRPVVALEAYRQTGGVVTEIFVGGVSLKTREGGRNAVRNSIGFPTVPTF